LRVGRLLTQLAALQVKWLSHVRLADRESNSHWQQHDYKRACVLVDAAVLSARWERSVFTVIGLEESRLVDGIANLCVKNGMLLSRFVTLVTGLAGSECNHVPGT
jgi:hypothetical protein